ncbi:hypothetical protein FP2506_05321 [Fulvimarina pelagi HTCC2506]|uniref:DUF4167 domain-containing protein n=1 Tax=Fulvimarina pelagi HTCC2506 TaxID=314231 RepID=Q0G7Y2_9HYPH|nr:DUF4167 domain-containing protein [Fulvimarina pelagi]EAU42232.1 hypothetical protein FP2506_05321 [Fulvimarina pelagi HTCC2506]
MRGRGRKGPNPLSRSYESNGPDVKIRGNAQHIADKYAQLARDASASGDRVVAENYLQHAEHYYRIIAQAQPQNQNQRDERDQRDDDDDDQHSGNDRFDRREFGNNDRQDRSDRNGNYDGDRQERSERRDRDGGDWNERRNRDNRDRNGRNDRPRRDRDRSSENEPAGSGPQPVIADHAASADGSFKNTRERSDAESGKQERFDHRDSANVEANQGTAASGNEDQAEKPRKRGRPRKLKAEDTDKSPAEGENGEGEAKPKRKPGRPRKVKADKDESQNAKSSDEQSELPDFLLASNG